MMIRRGIFLVCVLSLSLYSLPCLAQSAGSAALIKYGIIENSETVQKDARNAGGAVAGGMAGLIFSGPRHRLLKVAATSAAGAAIQGAVTSGTLQQYTVKLLDGTEIKVSTEQTDIRAGDCVAVERGQHVNIRHVGMVHCEVDYKPKPPAHHKSVATDCQKAKDELTKAENDKDLDLAVKKVRVLCGL